MRFEVLAALVMGALLPCLETCRRGLGWWLVSFTTMFEDYLAGALLLVAGASALRRRPWAPLFLVLAWAYCTGLLGSSFWGQLEVMLRTADTGCKNLVVVSCKLALWSTCVVALVLSFRRARPERS